MRLELNDHDDYVQERTCIMTNPDVTHLFVREQNEQFVYKRSIHIRRTRENMVRNIQRFASVMKRSKTTLRHRITCNEQVIGTFNRIWFGP